jgi:DNA-binding NtrC family response regulator
MRVLVVEDDPSQRELLGALLKSSGHHVTTAGDGEEALALIPTARPQVMITDLQMPKMDGIELMDRLGADHALPPTIVLTGFGSVELAVETVHKHGAFWFLEKPIDAESLRVLLDRAADHARLTADNERLRLQLSQHGSLGDLVGQSHAMQNIFALVRRVAPTNACVMVTGESGSGKELVARAIHSNSPRAGEPFLALNCAAMPETLMESEFFGHEKGAFTGAVDRQAGAFELAEGGTLFLDEIGEMPMAMQSKLLRVLEDFRFRRIGGKAEIQADVRLVSATNRAPEQAIRDGKLREDLYYRLNVFHIDLPPLRERLEDLPPIAEQMLSRLNEKHGTRVTHLSAEASETLLAHSWEGNVRELRNIIERAVILAGEGPIEKKHLLIERRDQQPSSKAAENGLEINVGMSLDEAERILIESTLKQAANNKTRAASVLGISAKTLHAKLRQYRLEEAGDSPEAEAAEG